MLASYFIRGTFDQQIREDTQELKTRLSGTLDMLVRDIHEKVQSQTRNPSVVRAIQYQDTAPPTIKDTVLDILEYGNTNGQIAASKLDFDIRVGERDPEALARAIGKKPASAIRLRKIGRNENDSAESVIEVTLPIRSGEKFLGFVTGGYFLSDRLNQILSNQRHPVFLREGHRLVASNPSAEKIPTEDWNALLAVSDKEIRLGGVAHSAISIPLPTSPASEPVELIVAYSHREKIKWEHQLVRLLFVAGGVGIAFVYIVSYVIGIQITKPIHQLTKGVSEIASGNLAHQVAVQTRDEVGQLARGFNQMAADLKMSLEKRLAAERVAAWRDVARRVAHEIKNPLFPIRLSVENLRKARSKPAIFDEIFDECTETLIEEVNRLQRMVDEFHQFARMPAPERKASHLNSIVQSVLNLYAESVGQIQIEIALDSDLPCISIDPEQIAQVLQNLIKNAIEAMPDGGTLKISTQLIGGKKVQIEIQDTGIGMSPETQAKLFIPYYTTKETGTGLGMAIVQRIITDHDGAIFVKSAEGVGTTVRIELPRSETDPLRA